VVITEVTFRIQPHIPSRLNSQPWGYVFPLLTIAALFSMRWFTAKNKEVKAFLASCAYIVGMLTSTAFGVYPYVLPSNSDPELGLTVFASAAHIYGITVGLTCG